jgi:hypothetical protein
MRWWLTRSGELRPHWPAPGLEHEALAMGWLGAADPIGVIEHPPIPVDLGVLEMLNSRFPNRRWFAGDWHAADTGDLAEAA